MPSSNTPLLNLSLLIDVTFSTPTPVNTIKRSEMQPGQDNLNRPHPNVEQHDTRMGNPGHLVPGFQLRDSSGKPNSRSCRIPDKEYRRVAGSRQSRRQQIVDSEIPVDLKGHSI